MQIITAQHIRAAVPKCANPAGWVDALNNATLATSIAFDRTELAVFLAQCSHESDGLNRLEESLSYTAERLMQVWPSRFPNLGEAAKYARRPHELADKVYAGRMGNGDESSGDGWRYRGRGLVMVTGRANYATIARLMALPALMECPDRLMTKPTAAMAAATWWCSNPKLRALAHDDPTDNDEADFLAVTRIVNGGTLGLDDRRGYRDRWLRAFEAA